MSLKSLTSSRKIIDIINRYGHCSYNVIEELETEATFSSSNRSNICPEGIVTSANLFTGVAFDNFDRYVETTSNKNTLHDTVGIIYQNVSNFDAEIEIDNIESEIEDVVPRKKRRTFDAITSELISYPKKAKMVEVLLPNDNQLRQSVPVNLDLIKKNRYDLDVIS